MEAPRELVRAVDRASRLRRQVAEQGVDAGDEHARAGARRVGVAGEDEGVAVEVVSKSKEEDGGGGEERHQPPSALLVFVVVIVIIVEIAVIVIVSRRCRR